ncbi:transposase family protein [Pseudarthrobacter sp. CCNWLW207]
MIEPTSPRPDAATAIFNLPDYRVTDTAILTFGQRRISIDATAESGCPACGVISARVHSRRPQRLRDIPVAGPVEVIWAKRRFAEETARVPRRARSTRRLRDALVAAVIGSGRAAAEAASSFGVSWWLVQRALDPAALTLPNVDALAPRMLGIDEHRYRSVRFSATQRPRSGNATNRG